MSAIATAVISSTIRGLPEHRKAAQDACLRAGFFPEMMEHLGPTPADAVKESLAMVDKADVYVLILGVRYGEIPDGYDKSFTHLELDRAVERGLPKLILIMDTGKHPLVADDVEKGPGAEHLDELRTRLRREQVVSFFSSADEMRTLLVQGLSKLKQSVAPATPSIHYVRELTSPPDPYVAHPYTLLQTTDVIGRQRELNVLTDWVSNTSSQLFEAHILSLIAIGGMGKSAITWKWFNDIAPHEMPALCGRVWWSFYESDAHFDNFVIRTLAYVTRRPLEVVKELRPGEREEELLDVLDREPHLIVLDGLERLLIAYARPDANRLADDDLDVQTANVVADALGLPPSAAASYTGQSRLRLTADPRAGSFLRRLSQISESRVLVSSRLFPADLQTVTGAPVVGAAAYFLGGLDSDDAVNLWRAFQVTGRRDELVALFQTFDNYPLLVRALAGEVARFRRAPGDFDAWRASHPDFDPFRLPLTQRKAHVLQYALRGLAAPETRLLHLIAAFRMPAQFATLTALTVGPGLPFHDEAELDAALFNLEDRGLVGWDKRANRYDLHPVVRGVAWSTVDSQSQRGIYSNVAKHFESLPHLDVLSAKTIDDLAAVIELYHTLVRLERGANAFEILYDRIWAPAFRLGAFRQLGELTELLLSEPAALMDLDEEDRVVHLAWMGFAFQTCGFPERYLDAYEKIGDLPPEQERHFRADLLAIRAMAQRLTGSLAAAHASAQNSLVACVTNHKDDVWRPWPGVLALGLVLATLGDSEAMRWLEDYRLTQTEERVAVPTMAAYELGWMALHHGDIEQAQRFADGAGRIAERTQERMSFIQVAALRGAIALHRGNLPIADDHLHRALTQARELGLADEEASVLILLADRRLREGQTDIARQHIADADPLIERGQLRLRRVDSLNMLSRIEYACGDNASAARAAADAWRAAWCDGPPFAYAKGLRQARENLALAGAPEPADLPRTAPSAADLALSPLSTQDVVNLANSETDESERQLPVEALLRRGMADDVDALRWLVLEASEQTRSLVITRAARSYLGESDVGRELWRRLVSDGDRAGLAAAMEMLNQTPSDGAVQLLTRLAASDPSATVRAAAREALASHRRRFDVR